MRYKTEKQIDWNSSKEEKKKLIKSIFKKMGGDSSKITSKMIDHAIEVTHQDFTDPVIITRMHFDDRNLQEIEKALTTFLK